MVSKKVFIVAEVGINHNGDIELAKECIKAAAEAGANSVKFQNYKTENFLSNRNLKYSYLSQGVLIEESQYEMFKRCELRQRDVNILFKECKKYNLDFHCTPTDLDGINFLKKLGCKFLKNGSDYLTNLDLIKSMGESGLTTILSTGMATLSEIDDAVRVFKKTGNKNLILLICTSSYPTPPKEVNLARIDSLRRIYNLPIGFSDHTEGVTASVGAVFNGAMWIEKHFTLDKNLAGPDHRFSMDPDELKLLVASIREAEVMIGSSSLFPTKSEQKSRKNFRLSCVASRSIPAGHILTRDDISFRRPGSGLPPKMINFLIDRKIKNSKKLGDVIKNNDLF